MHFRLAALFASVLAPAGVLLLVQPSADAAPAETPSQPYGAERPKFEHLSSAGCAGASCHGGGTIGRKGSEHSTWAADEPRPKPADPHARAYRVLQSADSERMANALNLGPAFRAKLCLGCHAVDGAGERAHAEGVGCGGCHGPAEKWLAAHTTPEWKAVPARERWEKYGFAPTKNLVARTLACAGCHVGDAAREVNHDLLAAGHPRLAFETARAHFTPNYLRHWTEKPPQPGFEVRAWVIGQGVQLRAATELLRARASRADTVPWPEFGGQSCYACHHPIADKAVSPRVPGWEVWHTAAFAVAERFAPDVFGVGSPRWEHLPKLRAVMADKRKPDPKAVTELAAKAVAELDRWLAALQAAEDAGLPAVSHDLPRTIARALAKNADTATDWDALAAHYLGVAAMYHASGGKKAVPTWTGPVRELEKLLAFPKGFNSPTDLDREAVRTQFAALKDATEPEGK